MDALTAALVLAVLMLAFVVLRLTTKAAEYHRDAEQLAYYAQERSALEKAWRIITFRGW